MLEGTLPTPSRSEVFWSVEDSKSLNSVQHVTSANVIVSNWISFLVHVWWDSPEPSEFEVELAIEKLKSHKSPGIDQIPAELIKAGGKTICCAIHKLITVKPV